MKFVKLSLSCFLMAALLSPSFAFASSSLQKNEIPSTMPAGTVITFNENNYPVITKNGTSISTMSVQKSVKPNLSLENPAIHNSPISLEAFNATLEQIRNEAKKYPTYYIEDEKPQPGTIVTYGSDGQINTITNPLSSSLLNAKTISATATAENGTYIYGAANNTITITSTKVSGVGRFTVFDDTIGDHDNVLVAGDVATKGAYDNPKSGTKITATANDITKTVTKNDNGSLPNAVLDLKKWSGVMFGYTYSSTLSFSGSYYYNK